MKKSLKDSLTKLLTKQVTDVETALDLTNLALNLQDLNIQEKSILERLKQTIEAYKSTLNDFIKY